MIRIVGAGRAKEGEEWDRENGVAVPRFGV